jgi:uncharacterized membrane protein HdeD (DUF308 family)
MTSTPASPSTVGSLAWMAKIHRGQIVTIAVVGLLLGIIGLLFPGATLYTVAVLFGSFLIATGIFRIMSAVIAADFSVPLRWLNAVLGALIVIAGIMCLSDPFRSLIVLAIVIGLGWIADGIVDLIAGVRGAIHPRWFGYVSGIVSIAAGVAMFVLPASGLAVLVTIGSVLLIIVSLSTLLMIPRKPKTV